MELGSNWSRKKFIHSIAAMGLLPLLSNFKTLNTLEKISETLKPSERMPVLFLGHGSPMNAIEQNEFVSGFVQAGATLPKPQAILCISAHWETKGTMVTAMEHPKTIHDFGGFPQALFDVQYPAPGSPVLAKETAQLIHQTQVGLDHQWGLDHGAWSVIKHLYPKADVPVVQLSLDYTKDAAYHYQLAKELAALRNKGVLIVGSGNMVHNLGILAWDKLNTDNFGYEWAMEANTKMKEFIMHDNHQALIDYRKQGKAFDLSIPTPEHFLPLLYCLALKDKKEEVSFFNDKAVAGSLTMTSVKIQSV